MYSNSKIEPALDSNLSLASESRNLAQATKLAALLNKILEINNPKTPSSQLFVPESLAFAFSKEYDPKSFLFFLSNLTENNILSDAELELSSLIQENEKYTNVSNILRSIPDQLSFLQPTKSHFALKTELKTLSSNLAQKRNILRNLSKLRTNLKNQVSQLELELRKLEAHKENALFSNTFSKSTFTPVSKQSRFSNPIESIDHLDNFSTEPNSPLSANIFKQKINPSGVQFEYNKKTELTLQKADSIFASFLSSNTSPSFHHSSSSTPATSSFISPYSASLLSKQISAFIQNISSFYQSQSKVISSFPPDLAAYIPFHYDINTELFPISHYCSLGKSELYRISKSTIDLLDKISLLKSASSILNSLSSALPLTDTFSPDNLDKISTSYIFLQLVKNHHHDLNPAEKSSVLLNTISESLSDNIFSNIESFINEYKNDLATYCLRVTKLLNSNAYQIAQDCLFSTHNKITMSNKLLLESTIRYKENNARLGAFISHINNIISHIAGNATFKEFVFGLENSVPNFDYLNLRTSSTSSTVKSSDVHLLVLDSIFSLFKNSQLDSNTSHPSSSMALKFKSNKRDSSSLPTPLYSNHVLFPFTHLLESKSQLYSAFHNQIAQFQKKFFNLEKISTTKILKNLAIPDIASGPGNAFIPLDLLDSLGKVIAKLEVSRQKYKSSEKEASTKIPNHYQLLAKLFVKFYATKLEFSLDPQSLEIHPVKTHTDTELANWLSRLNKQNS
ncbi:hypothetical protein BB560_007119 [Smittium megazygosporum]|uniref:Uncharacterized protein n=1 Tax=Smittium megazygosporum TaxID=133381 RepID=A0A2T9XYS2_9FUNG|nr:hypothetical protein BB560_007119 [Smittium megazygosporum]